MDHEFSDPFHLSMYVSSIESLHNSYTPGAINTFSLLCMCLLINGSNPLHKVTKNITIESVNCISNE